MAKKNLAKVENQQNFELTKEDVDKINKIKFQQERIMTEVKKMF